MQEAAAPKVSFVSLGCPKALVDSERIITRLRAEGYELARKHDGADIVIVNTCGFLDSAKQESLGAIGEAMAENGKVIVTGCMGAEPEQIEAAYPGVLSITGPQQYESVLDAVHRALPPRHYAYLKISEGCNNRCSFCIIPKLRGDLVSRPANDVLREAEKLVNAGVKELLVISQDTSAYGVDLKYASSPWKDREVRAKFFDLAKELGEFGAWVRLQYVYPYPHVDQVIGLMNQGKILPYLDIPFQHASPEILKQMKRPAAQDKTLARIKKWREECPELTLRSTFIVGFPGDESGAQRQLRAFLAPLLDPRQRLVLRCWTLHLLEDLGARVLKGNIEIGQHLALRHQADDFIDMRVGVDILQPHPGAELTEFLRQIKELRADLAILPRARGIFQIDPVG